MKMANWPHRHSTIIYDENGRIVGLSGRALDNRRKPKWKHGFPVSSVVFPLYLNRQLLLDCKIVILVESLGDCYSLWAAGIKNVICLFGIKLHKKMISTLIGLNPSKIIIALNNDKDSRRGNNASFKMQSTLNKFFDPGTVEIRLPYERNDWNEMLCAGV